eukprot:2033780-Rhodomonas_salina.1
MRSAQLTQSQVQEAHPESKDEGRMEGWKRWRRIRGEGLTKGRCRVSPQLQLDAVALIWRENLEMVRNADRNLLPESLARLDPLHPRFDARSF